MHKFAECGLQHQVLNHLVAQVHFYQYLLDTVQCPGQNKDMIVIAGISTYCFNHGHNQNIYTSIDTIMD